MMIREPAVAGRFYPRDRDECRQLLKKFVAAAELKSSVRNSKSAVLGGVDGVVFTAGIGENSPEIRRRICEASSWLGIELDNDANDARGPRISTDSSKVSVWTIPTNEEMMIALHTGDLLGIRGAARSAG